MNFYLKLSRLLKHINPVRIMSTRGQNSDFYVWIDLEMTGLDVRKQRILEIACIVTKPDLEPLHEGVSLVIHQPQHVQDAQEPWSKENHAKHGLTKASLESRISEEEADTIISNYIREKTNYGNHSGTLYLAGSSVHMDKMFLEKYMPSTFSLLSYRIIDVTAIKVLASHWFPKTFSKLPVPHVEHRSLSDIQGSIEKLKLYKEKFFIPDLN